MPEIVIGAGGALEAAMLPFHALRLRVQFRDLSVRIALTPGAEEFVTALALQSISNDQVYTEDLPIDSTTQKPMHMLLASASLLVLYPCTARIIAACALGLISCPVTRLFAFTPKDRIVVTPYLHPNMSASLYVDHIAKLRELGCTMVLPKNGGLQWTDESAWTATELAVTERLRLSGVALHGTFEVSS
ncbi:flavoprotein [Paraburkholderia megapolitana]|uniref:flavoprotein n=1 Tax=Paraburkholderia megapolitana TaxID=420953 RepID=UPI0038B7E061